MPFWEGLEGVVRQEGQEFIHFRILEADRPPIASCRDGVHLRQGGRSMRRTSSLPVTTYGD